MLKHLRASLLLLMTTVVIFCVLYPLVLLGIGKTVFPNQSAGSLVDRKGQPTTDPAKAVGSRLIAQAFTKDEYFQPRPSNASYNGAASSASNYSANNTALRDRVAASLGPIVKYKKHGAGPEPAKLVGPDIDAWFAEQDSTKAKGAPGLLSRWANSHPTAAQNWVGTTFHAKNPTPQQQYVLDWAATHVAVVEKFKKDNPTTPDPPQPSDIAVPFFKSISDENPGKIPSSVDDPMAAGKKKIDLVSAGGDVQSLFFDLWLGAHPDADLEQVPGDLVTASASGLDPHITLDNAEYQLDRVAGEWAKKLGREVPGVHDEIEAMLQEKAFAPLGGLVGVKLINVLEMNLALTNRYEPSGSAAQ
jgi:potassium-transporting ATPase KdpC subunit